MNERVHASGNPLDFSMYRIVEADDPWIGEWLALYHEAFPVSERMSLAWLEQSLGARETYCAVVEGRFAGLALWEYGVAAGFAALWYLAVVPEVRGGGLGGRIYHEIVRRARDKGESALLFEVEMAEAGALAQRRIRWYGRQGARLLDGVRYVQSVDTGTAPIPMRIMAHAIRPVTPESVYAACREVFGEGVSRTSELALASPSAEP